MYLEEKSYGLRRRSTGDLVRVETYEVYEENGITVERTLVLDKHQPLFQSRDLKDVMRGRFSQEFFAAPSLGFDGHVVRLPGDMDDYEIVVFEAAPTLAVDGRDPETVEIAVRPLEFNLVSGVRMRRFSAEEADKLMRAAFTAGQIDDLSGAGPVEAVVLRGGAGMPLDGTLLLPPEGRITREGPVGVLLTRTVGDTVYALVTRDIDRPELHVMEESPKADEVPWGDCKVAYGWDAVDEADELLTEIWDEEIADRDKSIWPDGWSIDETDCSGARCVIVFRVSGVLPTREDGERVRELVSMIERGIDPRRPETPALRR